MNLKWIGIVALFLSAGNFGYSFQLNAPYVDGYSLRLSVKPGQNVCLAHERSDDTFGWDTALLVAEDRPVESKTDQMKINSSDPLESLDVFTVTHELSGETNLTFCFVFRSIGSGAYADLQVYALDNDRIRMVALSKPEPEMLDGYMGHDRYQFDAHRIIRSFPIYNEGDCNAYPSGGIRRLEYRFSGDEWRVLETEPYSNACLKN